MSELESHINVWSMPLYDQTGPEDDNWEDREKALNNNPEQFETIYVIEYVPPWDDDDFASYSYMLVL